MEPENKTGQQKEISFGKLSFQALPEMWTFQILVSVALAIPGAILIWLINWVAGAGGNAVTTANIKTFILSWRFPVIILLGIVLVVVYTVLELFAQIYLTNYILTGQRAKFKDCIGNGMRDVRKFMNPAGAGIILFIFIAVPLCGVGFSLSLSRSFYIPNFIMEVVLKNPIFTAAYAAVILLFIRIAFRSLFVLHAVLVDGMSPSEGKKYSAGIVKDNMRGFLKSMIFSLLAILVIILAANIFLHKIPGWILGGLGEGMPKNYRIDFFSVMENGGSFSSLDIQVMLYRIGAVFAVLVEKYLFSVVVLLCGAYFMLNFNRYYLEYSKKGRRLWPERPGKSRYIWKVVLIIMVFVLFGLISVGLGLNYELFFTREEPVGIVAHRAGGTMASENSLEGLEKAIEHGCYASEIDVQRTKDGYYIINHDNDFKRLTGVAKTPEEMTMDEIKELRITDTTGNGQLLPVVTFEEMLDVIKGKEKLFVELKGATADERMVDDVVRIIREHDCVEDTSLISLNYEIIDYAETNYPEFETGTLFFASLGNVANLNCDLLIMEEEAASDAKIRDVLSAGKQVFVWTVNTQEGMYKFLDSDIDGVITDEIGLAEDVQALLDERTDLQVLEDKLKIE
ncbi:MAG: glycerophosphoryl diester phosphodiesterase membrane domain-containing protein [Lachnospiraceae bacterium]|nr:glycerophosphoryl diester phosphodiesterase membrane domain-containing protein [Lachnospiraceae bacterium]